MSQYVEEVFFFIIGFFFDFVQVEYQVFKEVFIIFYCIDGDIKVQNGEGQVNEFQSSNLSVCLSLGLFCYFVVFFNKDSYIICDNYQ